MTATKVRKSGAHKLETASPKEPRFHEVWTPGDVANQGDLILVCIGSLPKSAKKRTSRQLADGNTTGSRHVLAGGKVFDADPNELSAMVAKATKRPAIEARYMGPVFSGECVLEHPQHQHQRFPDHAATVVVFQRNLTADEREERARD